MTTGLGDDDPPVLEVDRELCVGSTLCVQLAPDVFALDDQGLSTIVGDPAAKSTLVQEAEDNCPMAAIKYRPHPAAVKTSERGDRD